MACSRNQIPTWPGLPSQPCPACLIGPVVSLDFAFDISPDGSTVIYGHTGSDSTPPGIYLVGISPGSVPRFLKEVSPSTGDPLDFRFAPNGRDIVFVTARGGGSDLWVLSIDTGEERQVTFTYGNATSGDWDPSGSYIVYSRPFLNYGAPDTSAGLFIVDTKTLSDHALLHGMQPTYGGDPRWSPDSTRISFWYGTRVRDTSGRATMALHVYSVGVDGSDLRDLTPTSLDNCQYHDWIEGGGRILYEVFDRKTFAVHNTRAMLPDGSGNSLWFMDLFLGRSAVSRDGSVVVYTGADSSGAFGVLYLQGTRDTEGRTRRQITFVSSNLGRAPG